MTGTPEDQPFPKPEWVADDIIRSESIHNDALIGEWYTRAVMDYRASVLAKLVKHGALNGLLGWAIFHTDFDDGTVATAGAKTILVQSQQRVLAQLSAEGVPVPLVSIITNEPLMREDKFSFLTTQMTIDEQGDARYYVDALDGTLTDTGKTVVDPKKLMATSSPIFFAHEDNRLMITVNASMTAPYNTITDPEGELEFAAPFGIPGNKVTIDKIFALEQAKLALAEISELDPYESLKAI